MDNLQAFMEVYRAELEKAVAEHPEEYGIQRVSAKAGLETLATPAEFAQIVSGRMEDAMIRGSYNKDGRAFKATCKILGIDHTYKAINSFVKGS